MSSQKIVILHGWTKNPSSWVPVIDCLRAKGLTVEFPQIPGLSDDTDPVFTLDDYVRWLEGIIKEPVTLVCHSNGGRIAIPFVAKHPELVSKLILIDSAGLPLWSPLGQLKKSIFKTIAKLGKRLTGSKSMRRLLYKAARAVDYRDATANMQQTMANLIAVDLTPRLPLITSKTLIIWGARDTVTPVRMGHVLHAGIKDSRLEIISDAKHGPHATHPELLCKMISDFIA